MSTYGRHWLYQETPKTQMLQLFDLVGLKKGGRSFLGYSQDSLFETNANISRDISDKAAKLQDTSDLHEIRLNSHTALLLFFENVLQIEMLAQAKEDDRSIEMRLFNLSLVIEANPKFAIAYLNHVGSLLAA